MTTNDQYKANPGGIGDLARAGGNVAALTDAQLRSYGPGMWSDMAKTRIRLQLVISALTPSTAAAAATITLTVTGVDLKAGDVIWWDGVAKTTVFGSSTSISTASLAVGTARTVPVQVKRSNGLFSNILNFTVT